jgi:hypothetical protein
MNDLVQLATIANVAQRFWEHAAKTLLPTLLPRTNSIASAPIVMRPTPIKCFSGGVRIQRMERVRP